MNKRQRKVFTLLRTKTKAIGLNRKELEGLALKIDKNLQLEEDASDEEVDAAIEEAVDAALPFLEVSQSVAQRSIQTSLQRMRSQHEDDDDVDDDDDSDDDDQNDDEGGDRNTSQRGKNGKKSNKHNSEDSALMKLLKEQSEAIKSLKGQIDNLQGDRVHDARRTKLKKLVENTGTFGKSVLKQFDLMTFKDDEAFEDYLDDVQKDLDDLNQERANAGLQKLGATPPGGDGNKPIKNETEVMSDAEIIALAGGKPQNNNK
jgi:hypothetical protein